MANKQLFGSSAGCLAPAADSVNEAGGAAYQLSPKQALAQYAATGCLNDTFYAGARTQLDAVLGLCAELEPKFIAQAAVYARGKAFMKDMPALLCAVLSAKGEEGLGCLGRVFRKVIDNGKMLRNFVQIIRSGAAGRKSLGTVPKRLVLHWLAMVSDETIFRASVGNDPSIADVIKMVHPRPQTPERQALYGYLLGKEYDTERLPNLVAQYEGFKVACGPVPNVPFQMLASLDLGKAGWTEVAKNARWQMARMNLNTFLRHKVFDNQEMVERIAALLRDPEEVRKSRCFPYQLLTAYHGVSGDMPRELTEALQDAMEIACENVPEIPGRVLLFPDTSGSMSSPATGTRYGSTTATRCIDIAGLVSAALLRKNPATEVWPFAVETKAFQANPRDSIMTTARQLAALGGGGTNCSAPLRLANNRGIEADLVVYVSDNQSWVETFEGGYGGRATATMQEWLRFKTRCPNAKMVCIDIQPYGTAQAPTGENDILNVGGFSDAVFTLLANFARGGAEEWINEIERIEI